MEYLGYRIPKGWKISANFEEMHKASNNPDFDLTLDHNGLKQLENCPFGLGARMCIGYKFAKLELVVWLMHLLSKYEIRVEKSKQVVLPMVSMTVQAAFTRR